MVLDWTSHYGKVNILSVSLSLSQVTCSHFCFLQVTSFFSFRSQVSSASPFPWKKTATPGTSFRDHPVRALNRITLYFLIPNFQGEKIWLVQLWSVIELRSSQPWPEAQGHCVQTQLSGLSPLCVGGGLVLREGVVSSQIPRGIHQTSSETPNSN